MKHVFGLENELNEKEVSQVSGGLLGGRFGRPIYTTLALGEEGGDGGHKDITTMAIGEEGGDEMTTMAIGEEGGELE